MRYLVKNTTVYGTRVAVGRVLFILTKEDKELYFHIPVGSPLDPARQTHLLLVCYFLKSLYLHLLEFLRHLIQLAASWLFFVCVRNNDYYVNDVLTIK